MLKSVQAGRAVAAISVAAFHLSIMMSDARYGGVGVFGHYTREGRLGVDFFFVLSGFIIMFAHARDIGSPAALRSYLWRRWARLFPIYWLYTAGFVVLLLLGLGSAATMPVTATDWLTSVTLIRFSAADPPLAVAWTLFHELAFYLCFAVLIVNRWLGSAVLVVWGIVCLWVFRLAGEGTSTAVSVYTALPNLYFLMGIGAYFLMRRRGWPWLELLLGVAGVALVVAMWPTDNSRAGEFPLVVAFALLLAGVTKLERSRGNLPLPRALTAVGDASYSLYLLHVPLCGLLLKVMGASGIHDAAGGTVTYGLVLAGAIILSWVAYRRVEAPLLKRLHRWAPAAPPGRILRRAVAA